MSTPVVPPATQTRATMLQTLRTRCGLHATLGAASALEDILTEANEYVYQQLDDGLPWQSTLTLTANIAECEFITDDGVPDCQGQRAVDLAEQGEADRVPLIPGINHAMRPTPPSATSRPTGTASWSTPSGPWRYGQRRMGLRVPRRPQPGARALRDHRPAERPYRLVPIHAIARQAHYGKADADTAGQAFKTMLSKEKFKQKENRRFLLPSDAPSPARRVATPPATRWCGEAAMPPRDLRQARRRPCRRALQRCTGQQPGQAHQHGRAARRLAAPSRPKWRPATGLIDIPAQWKGLSPTPATCGCFPLERPVRGKVSDVVNAETGDKVVHAFRSTGTGGSPTPAYRGWGHPLPNRASSPSSPPTAAPHTTRIRSRWTRPPTS